MFDVANFLMRWLFLSNLIRDIAEIQTLPYNPGVPQVTPANNRYNNQYDNQYSTASSSSLPSLSTAAKVSCEDEWRDQCLRGILSYPPGTQRLLIMDAMRAELVERLSLSLKEADETLETNEAYRQLAEAKDEADSNDKMSGENSDANEERDSESILDLDAEPPRDDRSQNSIPEEPSAEEVEDAKTTIRVVRDYLPQLVSIVLKSPGAFDPRLVNPVDKLRNLIIRRCVDDANWGVDMCWLLEAEVGRAWKSLFEHRQQTGRRLIIVLPAEKAAVLQTIGSGKREAFDLLQDSEQATAFGYTMPFEDTLFYRDPNQQQYQERNPPAKKKLPSSLSLRRCSHFGDTMHFIDKLTKISLELRGVPIVHRNAYLQDSLREVNRRIRRRMVTRGDVSLDVEDHRGPDDWPMTKDVTSDMLMYSVHLPVDPKVSSFLVWTGVRYNFVCGNFNLNFSCFFLRQQNNCWPGGAQTPEMNNDGAVRILNIVVEESRVLASRERCPYLVRVEVADTNLRGNDSRLYASGAPGMGATMEEAMAMNAKATTSEGDDGDYHIPSELFAPASEDDTETESPQTITIENKDLIEETPKQMPRGGWQEHDAVYYSHRPEDVYATNPYDAVRETEYEQLHQQMYNENGMVVHPQQQMTDQRYVLNCHGNELYCAGSILPHNY